MDKKDCGQLMDKIFANIYNALIPSTLDEEEESTQMLSMMLPGITLDDSMNPDKPQGLVNVRAFVDRIPALGKNFVDSGKKISQQYAVILGAKTPEDDKEKAADMRNDYKAAQEKLYSGGQYTKDYEHYMKCQTAFEEAKRKYFAEKKNPEAVEDKIEEYNTLMHQAMENWIASGKQEIEEAIEIMTQYRAFTPASVFSDAIVTYSCSKSASGMETYFVPESWSRKPEELSWETVTVKEESESSHLHKDVSSVSSSFSAGFSAGLWGGKASGGYKSDMEHIQQQSQVDKFGMKFEVARVDIMRPWFNAGLLDYDNVYISGMKRGGICKGNLQTADSGRMGLYPTALLLARNITVYNEFGAEEKDFLNKSSEWSASAQVSYGPFSLSNDTSCSDSSEDDKEEGFRASAKINIGAKPQIIGIISTVLAPQFPRIDGPLLQAARVSDFLPESSEAELQAKYEQIPEAEKRTTQIISRMMQNDRKGVLQLEE